MAVHEGLDKLGKVARMLKEAVIAEPAGAVWWA